MTTFLKNYLWSNNKDFALYFPESKMFIRLKSNVDFLFVLTRYLIALCSHSSWNFPPIIFRLSSPSCPLSPTHLTVHSTTLMFQEQIQSSFSGRENSICRKMPVATVLTPISTIVPGLGDLSLPSSGVPSPITRHTLCTNSLSAPCHMPAPPQLPCHVPAPQILNATTLQQHVSLDSFTVETVKYNTEVSAQRL